MNLLFLASHMNLLASIYTYTHHNKEYLAFPSYCSIALASTSGQKQINHMCGGLQGVVLMRLPTGELRIVWTV